MHANIVLSQDILDYSPLFGEIADAYFEREMYAGAVRIYETLGGDPGVSPDFVTYSILFILFRQVACMFCYKRLLVDA
jgi:general transcription factor 3C polypeptide 3 (transcription factor C subunit 4)